ncbi:hypothetical protein FRB98_009595 [Tulasnella sp. 332]|nr:hypothetical protein FRB98_009595 [Tulasnella sp. 332]
MADAEGISLEETNKIRISLGLKPLTDDKEPVNKQEATAEDNYAKRREEEREQKKKSDLQARIDKNKNKRELNRRLVGATLGDADDGADDTLNWVKRSKKQEKKLAAKRQADLDSRDTILEDYTEKDLAGLKVSHDFEDLNEGENRILTLKDSRILDNEEDELHNIDMAEDDKDKKRKDLKTKRRDYTGYDDDEFTNGTDGLKKSVLAKYDEDILGAQENQGFRLGAGEYHAKPTQRGVHEQNATAINKTLLSIDYAKNQEISDYAEDKGFKKPKTKKKKSSRRAPADIELAEPVAEETEAKMQVDPPSIPRERDMDANFIDDEDLQAALARSRRQKVKRVKVTPEQIAAQLAQERTEKEAETAQATMNGDTAMSNGVDEDNADGDGLTFDDTTEFVRAITYDPVLKQVPQQVSQPIAITIKTRRSPERDAAEALTEMDIDVKREDGDDSGSEDENDEAALNFIAEALSGATGSSSTHQEPEREDDGASGLAGTLSILRKQGVVTAPTQDVGDREKIQKANDEWLVDNRRRLAMREVERLRAKGSTKDQTQREYENRLREQHDARDSMDSFKNYKPDVEIKYYDEFGREMDKKEAWKALSHRFHGKGSGKMKTEKRLKKIADEKKRAAMISGDTPTSMNEAFQKRQAKVGTAHMVLSVGNRGAVPQLEDVLDNAALSKASKAAKAGKGKKKEDGSKTPIQQVDMTSFAVGNSDLAPGIVPISAVPTSTEGSPAPASTSRMRPAFARIGGGGEDTAGSTPPSGSGYATPVGVTNGPDRTKVRIGFGVKRKGMDDDGVVTPPVKRR